MKKIKTNLIFYLILLGILTAVVSGGVQVYRFQVFLVAQMKDRLQEAVTYLPNQIDPELILKGADVNFSQDERFIQTLKLFRSVAHHLKLTHLYALVPNEEGQFIFSLNANDRFAWELDFDSKAAEPNAQGTIYPDISPFALKVWDRGELKVTEEFYTDQRGTFLSAFYPVKNAQGQKIYLLGAEIKSDEAIARITTAWMEFGVALLGSMVFSLVLALGLSSGLSRPINRLKDFALGLAQKNFNLKLPLPKEKNEIYQLYLACQTMADEMKTYITHLEDLLNQKINELTTINQNLSKRQEEMERDLQLANRIQRNILPNEKNYPKFKEVQFSSAYQSLSAVGGDFYDIIRRGKNQFGLLIADVSGHGVQAALITTMAKVSFNAHSSYNAPPGIICEKVNQELIQLLGGEPSHFVTAYYGCFDLETAEFSFTNAGHHAAILVRHFGREILRLGKTSPFLGMFPQAQFFTETIQLIPGDTILLFTDGIIEAMNSSSEIYDEHRLIKYLQLNGGKHSKKLVEGILEDVRQFCGSQPPSDDQAILLMRYHGNQRLVIESESASSTLRPNLKEKLKVAIQLAKEKNYQKSFEIFEEIYHQIPTDPKVVANYAFVLDKLKQYQKAEQILQQALKLHQNNQELSRILKVLKTKVPGG